MKEKHVLTTERFSQLEAQFDAKSLASVFYGLKDIDELPDTAEKGVLMVRPSSSTKWKKRCVALVDRFLFVYNFDQTAEPVEVYDIKQPVVQRLPSDELENCFQVSLWNAPLGDSICLRAANPDIMNRWISYFEEVGNRDGEVCGVKCKLGHGLIQILNPCTAPTPLTSSTGLVIRPLSPRLKKGCVISLLS